jgi:hypothetical protein
MLRCPGGAYRLRAHHLRSYKSKRVTRKVSADHLTERRPQENTKPVCLGDESSIRLKGPSYPRKRKEEQKEQANATTQNSPNLNFLFARGQDNVRISPVQEEDDLSFSFPVCNGPVGKVSTFTVFDSSEWNFYSHVAKTCCLATTEG